jgi:alpha-N-arabinofuranosidase
MERSHRRMNAISLHHYVRGTGNWTKKGSATKFDESEWFALMKNTLTIYPLLEGNIKIMDRFDPRGRIGLFVDEWGTWWDNEPGTNPGFLYQQNTLRDALSAGIFLNAFNKRCDRVKMANIAQTVNVLQAMILTKDQKMVLTPTYHVFEMYKIHQDATMLPVEMNCGDYQFGDEKITAIDVSASKDKSGRIHITLCNLNPNKSTKLVCELQGTRPSRVTGRILTANTMNAHNTFDKPNNVQPNAFNKFDFEGDVLTVTLPPKSIVLLGIK